MNGKVEEKNFTLACSFFPKYISVSLSWEGVERVNGIRAGSSLKDGDFNVALNPLDVSEKSYTFLRGLKKA